MDGSGTDNDTTSQPSVGTLLRRKRESLNTSIEQTAVDLAIPEKKLAALETEDFSVFTADVYARGACVKYAEYLGLDAERVHRAAQRALSQERNTRDFTRLRVPTPQRWFERFMNPRAVIVAGLVLIALTVGGYIVWQVRSFWQLPTVRITQPTGSVIEDGQVTLRGQADPDTHVRVNGEQVLLQEGAVFELPLYLHPGINVVRIEAENAAGRTRVIETHLLYPRGPLSSSLAPAHAHRYATGYGQLQTKYEDQRKNGPAGG